MSWFKWKRFFIILAAVTVIIATMLTYFTVSSLKPAPESFHDVLSDSHHIQILDRYGNSLNTTYQNNWNIHNIVELHQVPEFLKTAFIISEDKRFYQHSGPDWLARGSALLTNIKTMRAARGASTITEQVVRMIHPRPRTVWSRWLEGFEAKELGKYFTKNEVLEFYLNQVPYAANRRGVSQAARYYFNRDLEVLSKKEMLALIVLVRAPSRLDLWKNTEKIESSINHLADQLIEKDYLSEQDKTNSLAQKFDLEAPKLSVHANEFVRHVKNHPLLHLAGWPHVRTTLDGRLQQRVQTMLDRRLKFLKYQKLHNGAVLAVDHTTGEILVWAVAGKHIEDTPGRFIDAVTTPRQPGSSLKPLLYSLALEEGWSAATIIDDAPLTESVGNGLHSYQNYSRTFYGPVTLRQALGNSLNIPALRALQYVGPENYLSYLNNLGFTGLNNHPNFYGDGIALGNGEVTLYELVQAYAAIASGGMFHPLTLFSDGLHVESARRVLSPEIASLVGNILSDRRARELEFGEYSVLNFPIETAVKTGTSSDYRDSLAIGFNYRYTVGVWMGNLDGQPTDGITGSTGPALLLRSVFSELNKHQETRPLSIHKKLVKHDLCVDTKQSKSENQQCETYTEWFAPGTAPMATTQTAISQPPLIRLRRPAHGLHIAYDPRVTNKLQAFEFFIQGISDTETVKWDINGRETIAQGGKYSWPLQKGKHEVQATIWRGKQQIAEIKKTRFVVK
ncbi:MAG: transglycosylase domain-containing protein [Pseudomonadota bacterium]